MYRGITPNPPVVNTRKRRGSIIDYHAMVESKSARRSTTMNTPSRSLVETSVSRAFDKLVGELHESLDYLTEAKVTDDYDIADAIHAKYGYTGCLRNLHQLANDIELLKRLVVLLRQCPGDRVEYIKWLEDVIIMQWARHVPTSSNVQVGEQTGAITPSTDDGGDHTIEERLRKQLALKRSGASTTGSAELESRETGIVSASLVARPWRESLNAAASMLGGSSASIPLPANVQESGAIILSAAASGIDNDSPMRDPKWLRLETNWPYMTAAPKWAFKEHQSLYNWSIASSSSRFSAWLLSQAFDHPKAILTATSIVGRVNIAAFYKGYGVSKVLLNCCKDIYLREVNKKKGRLLESSDEVYAECDFSTAKIERFLRTAYGSHDSKKRDSRPVHVINEWKLSRGIGRYMITDKGVDTCKTNSRKKIRSLLTEILGLELENCVPEKSVENISRWPLVIQSVIDLSERITKGLVALKGAAKDILAAGALTRDDITAVLDMETSLEMVASAIKEFHGRNSLKIDCAAATALHLLLPRWSFGQVAWSDYLCLFLVTGFPSGKALFDNDQWCEVLLRKSNLESNLLVGYAVAVAASLSPDSWADFARGSDIPVKTAPKQELRCMLVNQYFVAIAAILEADRQLSAMLPTRTDCLTPALASKLKVGSGDDDATRSEKVGSVIPDLWDE
jgi:hypothetical protein